MKEDTIGGERAQRRGLPGIWTIALAVLGMAAVSLGAFGVVRAYQFVEDDPRFCRTCHTMREAWDQWHSGEHREVTCHSCHEADLIGSLRQVLMYVTQRPDEVETHAKVSAATCLNCHRPQEETAQADLRHAIGERTDCLLCHGQELHRVQPGWSDFCASCH